MSTTLLAVLAVLMMATGAGFIYFIVSANDRPLPQGGVQWAATVVSTLLIVFSAFLLVLTVAPGEWSSAEVGGTDPRADEMNRPAPNFTFLTLDDDLEMSLADFKGKVVILNFWATWCAPCIAELPDLNRLQANYEDDGLAILTISDETPDVLKAFEENLPLKTVKGYLPEPETLPQPFRRTIEIRPTTYVIDREGQIREFLKGAGNYTYFEQLIQPYLQPGLASR